MSDWYKDGYFWNHDPRGDSGDLIFNTMARIIDMNDKSDWAKQSFNSCMALLEDNKRWPDRLNQENTAKNRIQWWWNDWYTRPQDDMTRDPYIATICCALHLDMAYQIEWIKIPWYCFSPIVSLWRHKLIKDNQPLWKKRLDYYRAKAVVFKNHNDPNIIANENEAANS